MKTGLKIGHVSGFTLPEVLISGAVMAIGLGAALAVLGMSRRTTETAQRKGQAMHTARGVVERLTAQSFHSSQLTLGRHHFPGGHYDVSAVPGDTRTRQIDVRVQWISAGRNRTNEFPLTTWISQTLHP